ncbi:DUF4031 domain-containing protein [Undibacterium sp. Di26W]|uniref:DUF4031 domain-containing protein n=1 Tax=Undibacterium sp. Di26W TaxID=3413035 RepID=UPI003BF06BAD
MAVYVDRARYELRGELWCHMVADSIDELHAFAKSLGLRKDWFQSTSFPHYDLTVFFREKALYLGAIEGGRRQIIACARQLKTELSLQTSARQEQLTLFS